MANIAGSIDTVIKSINYTLTGFIENLTLASGAGPLAGVGNTLDNVLQGNESPNTLSGLANNDTLIGAGGHDTLDGGTGVDQANFTGPRSKYVLSRTTDAIQVADTVANRDGADSVRNTEFLRFSDRMVDLAATTRSQTISAAGLKTLEELYVGFFNRIPDAAGLGYWVSQHAAGASLTSIANQFFNAGVQAGTYSASMTNQQFITKVYENLGRGPHSADAPSASEIAYWNSRLTQGLDTKGSMVLTMLHDIHAYFENDAHYGYMAALLNNKATVSNYYAVREGLSAHTATENISFGVSLAALVTPTDTSAAIALIGVTDSFST